MKNIRIERLNIRYGVMGRDIAEASSRGMGKEIMDSLSKYTLIFKKGSSIKIKEINAGVLDVSRGATPAELRGAVATKISSAIASEAGLSTKKKR